MINPRRHLEKLRRAKLPDRLKEKLAQPVKEKLFSLGQLFAYIVVVPTLISIFYFGPIASDVYISESKFVVRSPQAQPQAGIGGILSSIGVANSGENGFVVVNYVKSMDAMMAVNNSIDLKKLFTSADIDVFNRFASFYWNTSYERLLKYFNDHIEIIYEPASSIATLKVRSYTNRSAHDINLKLLEHSEALVNRLSDESRQDLIDFASYEIDMARKNLEKTDAALLNFRNQKDPDVNNFIPRFQQLQLERDTAEKQMASAIAALEQARVDAQRKRLYIERIVNPNLPDYPLEPKRIYGILATLLVSLIVYGIVRMVVGGVKEHHG